MFQNFFCLGIWRENIQGRVLQIQANGGWQQFFQGALPEEPRYSLVSRRMSRTLTVINVENSFCCLTGGVKIKFICGPPSFSPLRYQETQGGEFWSRLNLPTSPFPASNFPPLWAKLTPIMWVMEGRWINGCDINHQPSLFHFEEESIMWWGRLDIISIIYQLLISYPPITPTAPLSLFEEIDTNNLWTGLANTEWIEPQ